MKVSNSHLAQFNFGQFHLVQLPLPRSPLTRSTMTSFAIALFFTAGLFFTSILVLPDALLSQPLVHNLSLIAQTAIVPSTESDATADFTTDSAANSAATTAAPAVKTVNPATAIAQPNITGTSPSEKTATDQPKTDTAATRDRKIPLPKPLPEKDPFAAFNRALYGS